MSGTRRRVGLLGGQALALGLALAWLTIPANSLFIAAYGADALPLTYLGAAVAGGGASVLLTRSLRRRPLVGVAVRLLVGLAAALVVAWALLRFAGSTAVSAALVVLVPVTVPVGFMFVVGQAGRLLDVRVMKAMYPRVIAGFALGFTAGGVLGAPLLSLLGGTEQLLLASAATLLLLLGLVSATRRAFPEDLSGLDDDGAGAAPPGLRTLLSDRFVVLVLAFQMLSAIESQWLDYLVYDRAAARYPDPDELAGFVGRFTAIAYGANIVFLLLVAGLLLRRFGLRFGLVANSGAVLAMVAAVLAAGATAGAGATVAFVLVVAARVTDMVLADGMSRTSISAAYQAVPAGRRQAAQSVVESLAVPVAIGLSGVVLLVLQATVGTGGPALPVVVAVVVSAWLACGLATYRSYRTNLLENLRHRVLEPGDLAIEGVHALPVVERLLAGTDPRDVGLGLRALCAMEPPDLAERLEALALDAGRPAHAQALEALAERLPDRALEVARQAMTSRSASLRAAGLGALGASPAGVTPGDRAAAVDALADPDPAVRCAAAAATSRIGDRRGTDVLTATVGGLAAGADAADRRLAAAMLGGCEDGPWRPPELLGRLLVDPDPTVAQAAVDAVRWPHDAALAPVLVGLLARRGLTASVVDRLGRGGNVALAAIEPQLTGAGAGDRRTREACARAARAVGGPEAAALLARAAGDPDRDVGLAVLRAWAAVQDGLAEPVEPSLVADLVRAELAHAARVASARAALDGLDLRGPVVSALTDELELLRQRVLAVLSVRYGSEPLGRVGFQLAQPDPRVQAMALEWLDVTLAGAERPALALLDRTLAPAVLARTLARASTGVAPAPEADTTEVLGDLAVDPQRVWRRPWLQACAVLAGGHLDLLDLDSLGELRRPTDQDDADPPDILTETLTALAAR